MPGSAQDFDKYCSVDVELLFCFSLSLSSLHSCLFILIPLLVPMSLDLVLLLGFNWKEIHAKAVNMVITGVALSRSIRFY